MTEAQRIKITAQPDVHPERCLFRVDKPLYSGSLAISDPETAKAWVPLAAAIFAVGGIRSIRIAHSEVLVCRDDSQREWRDLAKEIGTAMREQLDSGDPPVKEGAAENLTGTDSLRHRAQVVIDDQLNPALAAHGGFVEIRDAKGNDLFITMGGGCQGCSAAAATMRQGVEVAIREAVPELGQIYDATDHAAGSNPFM